ncbi:hypothetical protein GTP91_08650 [Rugamonas sp. FT82W]|uniref:Uncharacterized protein n=1 Tax=Duganella vulcania TaxID=2692166 RepID=A0A845FXK4_9BURK|nr:hypothetical protein [Duganella vulcania]MYM87253.1 hypothetical protein [Duganella vulcania]
MSKPTPYQDHELKLTLTEEQRKELTHFIASHGRIKMDIDLLFEGDVSAKAVAPVAVLVGNAI